MSSFLKNEIHACIGKKYKKNRHISLAALKKKQKQTFTFTNFLVSTTLNLLGFNEDNEFGMRRVSIYMSVGLALHVSGSSSALNWKASKVLGKSLLNVSATRVFSLTSMSSFSM